MFPISLSQCVIYANPTTGQHLRAGEKQKHHLEPGLLLQQPDLPPDLVAVVATRRRHHRSASGTSGSSPKYKSHPSTHKMGTSPCMYKYVYVSGYDASQPWLISTQSRR